MATRKLGKGLGEETAALRYERKRIFRYGNSVLAIVKEEWPSFRSVA
jgi:hypothetical protein